MLPDYDDDRINDLILALFTGVVSVYNLPKQLYYQTVEVLKKGLYEGYGKPLSSFEFGTPDYELLKELRGNIYMFGAAKTFTQVLDLTSMMYEGNEKLALDVFLKKAKAVFNDYNVTKLTTEYTTTITSANSAKQWECAQENIETFPTLKALVIIDQNTSEMCLRMRDVVAPVNDPIWNHNMSPRHFNCRCGEELVDRYDDQKSTSKRRLENIGYLNDQEMNPLFKMNPGKDRIIWKDSGSDKHPYFDIAPKYKALAKQNFNLPIPDKD